MYTPTELEKQPKVNAKPQERRRRLGFEAKLWRAETVGSKHADSFHDDLRRDLGSHVILANSPFNTSRRSGKRLREDKGWTFSTSPEENAIFVAVWRNAHHHLVALRRSTSAQIHAMCYSIGHSLL